MHRGLAVGALVLAQGADAATFLAMYARRGIEAEANPVVVHIAEQHGLVALGAFKLSTTLFVALYFLAMRDRAPRLALAVLVWATIIGGVGAASNLVSM
jgi:hypothetical protein